MKYICIGDAALPFDSGYLDNVHAHTDSGRETEREGERKVQRRRQAYTQTVKIRTKKVVGGRLNELKRTAHKPTRLGLRQGRQGR